MATSRAISIELSDKQRRTLDLEAARLESLYGIRVSYQQIIRILIEQHRLKLRLTAEQDDIPDMLAWLWRKRNGEGD